MIKAVLFDVDGVLLNGELFSKQLARDYGIVIPEEFFEGEFDLSILGKRDLKELLGTKIKQWGWEKSVEELMEYWFSVEHQKMKS